MNLLKLNINFRILLLLFFILQNNIALCKKETRGFGDLLSKIWSFVTAPARPVWGAYTVNGQNSSIPLALFNRNTFSIDTFNIIEQIKNEDSDFNKIYKNIYRNGTNEFAFNIPTKTGSRTEFESRSTFAKNAAFVLVLGVDSIGNRLPNYKLNILASNVIAVINECDDNVFDSWFEKKEWSGWGEDAQLIRSQELINYCIALDLLRTAGYTWNTERDNPDNPKTALKFFTRKLYRFADRPLNTLSTLLNNNLTEITASAITLSAIINCNETDYFFKPNRQPDNWAKKGHCRIRETEFTAMLHTQSKMGDKYGHQEGPGYYANAMKLGVLPMAVAFDNFIGNNRNFKDNYTKILPFKINIISNYFYDPDWQNTFYWYRDIIQPNGSPPSYDDTRINAALPSLACTKEKKFSLLYGKDLINSFNDTYNDRADFLAANNPGVPFDRTVDFVNSASGDAVFRTPITVEENEQHYIHINSQGPGGVMEEFRQWTFGFLDHTHPSAGNITITAGKEILLMDPPYFGNANRESVNLGEHHNVITASGHGPTRTDNPVILKQNPVQQYIKISTEYEEPDPDVVVVREVQVHKFNDDHNKERYYYEIIDDFKVDPLFGYQMQGKTFNLNLNGNGILSDNSCNDSRKSNGEVIWKYPCDARGTWKLYSRTSLTSPNNGSLSFNISDSRINGNSNFIEQITIDNKNNLKIASGGVTSSGSGQEQGNYSPHATFTASVYGEKGKFQTILFPLRCDEPDFPADSFRVQIMSDSFYSVSTLNNLGTEKISNIHIKQGYSVIDTIIIDNSLFNSDPSQLSRIKIISDRGLFSLSQDSNFKMKSCVSKTKFRKAEVYSGKFLSFNDTVFIKASHFGDIQFKIIAPFRYSASINTDTASNLAFYLAGAERGVGMKVEGYSYTYDTGTCIMSVDVPIGLTEFEIELEDPCRVSCFFPSTAQTINTEFDFNEGITATLGHKLDIVQPDGFLNITKGSKMVLCDGIYLRNKDSLILYSDCGKDTGQVSISTCKGEAGAAGTATTSGIGGGAKPSEIIVKAGAALILEDNSFTQFSNNSELHVWGTLVIKAGAKLLIGDGRTCSYVTIMVYPGAYLHIEDDALLEFFKIVGDTQDRHIFFISKLPTAASANVGISPAIEALLINDTIISSSNVPVAICDLSTVTPAYGIANRDWGFCNVLAPKAFVRLPDDSICEGECLQIDFRASLNDPIRELEVCRIDTIMGMPFENCFGTWRMEGTTLEVGYNESTTCYSTEPHISFFPLCNYIDSGNHWYKIFVKAKNHCDQEDTLTLYFYVGKKPNAMIAVADSACPGYGTVKAFNLSTSNAEKAIWHVQLLDSTQYQENDENQFYYGGDWEVYNLHYGDSFEFPDLNWIGGFKYLVNLTQTGHCGEAISSWDTVEIQPGAKIIASPATVYSAPLGPSSLKLEGFIGRASSFSWSPTSYLDTATSLTPIATPTDTITYILTSNKDNCHAFDTLFVRVNTIAFAGNADTVCAEPVLLGVNFDASLFLAYQFFENQTDVWLEINNRIQLNPNFLNKFSLYFLSEAGKNAINTTSQYKSFLESIDRNQFYNQPWYISYYNQFLQPNNLLSALTYFFNETSNTGSLGAYIALNPLYDAQKLEDFLDMYQTDLGQANQFSMSAVWEKYTEEGTEWESMGNWDNQTKIWDSVYAPTIYKITVIDNVAGKVEYDQINIWADQPVNPQFYVQFQTDSTLYFSNASEPVYPTSKYNWDFGDGSTSNQINPIHTFPYFDSSYVICLFAENQCGSYMYCDTIRVDSNGLNSYSLVKPKNMDENNNSQIGIDKSDNLFSRQSINTKGFHPEGISVLAYPNPFNQSLNIAFSISDSYENGKIEIINFLGQTIIQYPITGNSGRVNITTDTLSSGLYTYQMILDKRLVQTGKLVKE